MFLDPEEVVFTDSTDDGSDSLADFLMFLIPLTDADISPHSEPILLPSNVNGLVCSEKRTRLFITRHLLCKCIQPKIIASDALPITSTSAML